MAAIGFRNGKVSVVIPALNEHEGIVGTINSIPRKELEKSGYDLQIIVVDNGSTDDTGDLARGAGAEVIYEPRRGYGHAYRAGFAMARGEIIATADADATYPVEDIPRLVNMLDNENLDFITTNRFAFMRDGAMSRRNKIGNAVLTFTTRVLYRVDIKDSQSGMWVFRRKILNNIVLKSNTPLSQELKIEACHFARCQWKEVPIEYRPRIGQVKLGGWKVGATNVAHLIGKRIFR